MNLTRAQLKLLKVIEGYIAQDGIAPSFEEMCEAMGLRSKSGIHRLILALEERGYIRRMPNRARHLEVIRSSSGASEAKVVVHLWRGQYTHTTQSGAVSVEVREGAQ